MNEKKKIKKRTGIFFGLLLTACMAGGCGFIEPSTGEIPTLTVGVWEEDGQDIVPEKTQDSLSAEVLSTVSEDTVPVPEETKDSTVEAENAPSAETPSEEEQKLYSFLEEDGFHYAYEQLDDSEKIWYRDIASMLGSMSKKGTLSKEGLESGLNEEDIDRIFQSVLLDHPELFYVEGYTYTKYTRGDKTLSYDFEGDYSLTKSRAQTQQEKIQNAVKDILAGISPNADDCEKAKYVYEKIILDTDYKRDSKDNQNIASVFLYHASVCQGYAKAYQYLLNRLGVDCTLVQGTVSSGEGHAWNLVKVNGSFYYVDCTWGDASYSQDGTTEQISTLPQINYDYLCVTTEELNRTHTVRMDMNMPECTENKDNYYVREGAYFTTYDRGRMKVLFQGLNDGTKTEVTIKCASRASYDEIFHAMLEQQEVFDYLKEENSTVAYTINENQLSLSFWVTND